MSAILGPSKNPLLPQRRQSRSIFVGNVQVGGGAPVSVQSMTTTDTADATATIEQIWQLQAAGCEIIRSTVNTEEAAAAIPAIKKAITIPLVADIHFDYRLALKAIEGGVDCLRINPGNIGAPWKVTEVVKACKERGIPIRIGVNGGSLEKDLLRDHGGATPEAIVASAQRNIRMLEEHDFRAIKVSVKSTDVPTMIASYRLLAARCDYPLHLGVTEAGTLLTGSIKSAMGMGVLLMQGIGDTIRVSLAADPLEEVRVGHGILRSLGLRPNGVNVIACPTCGRLEIDVIRLANDVEKRLEKVKKPLNVAVMGCVVNGPGEGKAADYAIAGGHGVGYLYRHGELVKKYADQNEMAADLLAMIEKESAEEETAPAS